VPTGPGAPPPGSSGGNLVGDPAVDAANAVARAIGLDPRVAYAWEKAEGNPGNLPGYYNWWNIKTTTAQSLGIPTVGTGPAGTAKFANIGIGESAAIAEITSPAIGLTNERGKSIAQQIADIGASPWASSHYGSPPGANLLRDFKSMYPGVDVGTNSQTPLPAAGGGASQQQTGIGNPLSPITDAIGSITDAFKFLFSYRFLEILGGGLLILLGLYILAQQFQKVALAQGIPLPGPAKDAVAAAAPARATVTPETRGQAAVDHQHREARASGEEGVRVLPSRRTAAPRPTMKRRVTTPAPSPTPARRRGVSSQPNRKPHGRQVRVKR
jgi:hypothetical protein